MPRLTIQQSIGNFIHEERTKQGLSLRDLSTRTFKSEGHANTISKIEKGELKGVTLEKVYALLKSLGYDMTDLFKKK